MLEVVIEEEGRPCRQVQVSRLPCRIGRGRDVEVQLGGWRVARVHAELQRIGRGLKLVDQGTLIGTRVNGERVVEYGPLSERDEIVVAGYRLRVQGEGLRLPAATACGTGAPDAVRDMPPAAEERMEVGMHEHGPRAVAVPATTVAGTLAGEAVGGSAEAPGSGGKTGDGVESASGRTATAVRQGAFGQTGRAARQGASVAGGGETGSSGQGVFRMIAEPDVSGRPAAAAVPRHRADADVGAGLDDDEDAQVLSTLAVDTAQDDHEARDGIRPASRQSRQTSKPLAARSRSSASVAAAPRAASARGPAAGAAPAGAHVAQADAAGDDAGQADLDDYARVADEQAKALGWRRLVHQQLLEMIDLRRSNLTQFSADELRAEVRSAVERIIAGLRTLPAEIDRESLVRDTVDEAVGLGPLERLMSDPLISEIMVNSATDIFVERQGRLQQVPLAFSDDDAIRNVIERIVAPLGRRIDESSPLVDARLADGSRVNAIIPPVALKGPTITIRRFNRRVMTPDTLTENGSASPAMMAFLRIAVEQRKNMIVSGGTGSGKTTLLNVLSNLIPVGERLITIEDAAELKLMHPHLVSLESRPANAEGRGAITIRDLVRNALRMRPDRIIVGECRGAEALDMMQAMNTGHEGSMTTVHANTPRDVLSRLEMLMLMAGIELPLTALREQVASAVDLIVHQARFADGSRRITSITEVCGVESGNIQTHEIFRYEQTGMKHSRVQGRFRACDEVPSFYEALRERGVEVDFSIFEDVHGES